MDLLVTSYIKSETEAFFATVDYCVWDPTNARYFGVRGKLIVSDYRVFFQSEHELECYRLIEVPISSVTSVHKTKDSEIKESNASTFPKAKYITIQGKFFQRFVIGFENKVAKHFEEWVEKFIWKNPQDAFCFQNKESLGWDDPWYFYPPIGEFERIGVEDSSDFVVSDINIDLGYSFYPDWVYFPNTFSPKLMLQDVASYREDNHYPVLTYANAISGVTLIRGNESRLTEKPDKLDPLLTTYIIKNPLHKANKERRVYTLYVGNRYATYLDTFLESDFGNLPNSSSLRSHYNDFGTYIHEFSRAKEDHPWIQSMNSYIRYSSKVAQRMKLKESVIVLGSKKNKSHFIITSLVQIIIDPYYRTIKGICKLIEKEWIGFAYPFTDSLGFKEKGAPYFEMFVNLLWVVKNHFPLKFEFNDRFLRVLLGHAYSCRFGSFLYNLTSLRDEIRETLPVWNFLLSKKAYLTNYYYEPDKRPIDMNFTSEAVWPFWYYYTKTYDTSHISVNNYLSGTSIVITLNLSGRDIRFLDDDVLNGYGDIEALDLSQNMLTSVPEAVVHMRSLTEINLSRNPLGNISPGRIDWFTKFAPGIYKLNCSSVGASLYPSDTLTLKEIIFSNNQNLSINRIATNQYLEKLDLSGCKINEVNRELENLQSLVELNFARNKVLSFDIALNNLKTIDLSENLIRNFPDRLLRSGKLRKLDLSQNQIETLPVELKDSNVNWLSLSHNPLKSLFEQNRPLIPDHLTFLDLSFTEITVIPPGIERCENLVHLDISHNRIEKITSEVAYITSLTYLNCSDNRIDEISMAIGRLNKLTVLILKNNDIRDLPPSLGLLDSSLKMFDIDGNPRLHESIPPEVLDTGLDNVLDFLRDLAGGSKKLYRIKLMMVGEENVGKTTLVHHLTKRWDATEEDLEVVSPTTYSTDGIDITKCSFKYDNTGEKVVRGLDEGRLTIDISFWDFAGQELYYTTHQFFLSRRSIFLAVWNMEKPFNQSRVEFWIYSITSKIPDAIMFIVGTHYDGCDKELKENLDAQLAEIREQYSDMFPAAKFYAHGVSCKSGFGMKGLKSDLEKLILRQPHMGENQPLSYLMMEKLFKEVKYKYYPPIITRDIFMDLGFMCAISSTDVLDRAGTMLHNYGQITYFSKDPLLSKLVVLDPQWLTNMMSTLITTKHRFGKQGLLEHSNLRQIWMAPDYPVELYPFFLAILQKFEISYDLSSERFQHIKSSLNYTSKSIPTTISIEPVKRTNSSPTLNKRMSVIPLKGGTIKKIGTNIMGMLKNEELSSDHETDEGHREFGIAGIEIEHFNESGVSLIPSLLDNKTPDEVETEWTEFPKIPCKYQNTRLINFEFLPNGFFSRLIVRMLNLFSDFTFQKSYIWGTGMLFKSEIERVEVLIKYDGEMLYIVVRTEIKSIGVSLFCKIMSAISVLLEEWPSLHPKEFTVCTGCLESGRSSDTLISLEDLEELTKAAIGNFSCSCDMSPSIERMVPDVAMVYFPGYQAKFDELNISEELGKGGFAVVYKGEFNGTPTAIKRLERSLIDQDDEGGLSKAMTDFRKEIFAMSLLDDPHCLKLLCICLDPLCLVTEFMPHGDLSDFIHDLSVDISWELRIKIALDISTGMCALHAQQPSLLHLDLKSPNVLLKSFNPKDEVCAVVSDFGTSSQGEIHYTRVVDCPIWLAPEVMNEEQYGAPSDVYSFGVILFEILERRDFFGELNFMSKIENAVKEGLRPEIQSTTFGSFIDLMKACWSQNPQARPTFLKCQLILQRLYENVEFYLLVAQTSFYYDLICKENLEFLLPQIKEEARVAYIDTIETIFPKNITVAKQILGKYKEALKVDFKCLFSETEINLFLEHFNILMSSWTGEVTKGKDIKFVVDCLQLPAIAHANKNFNDHTKVLYSGLFLYADLLYKLNQGIMKRDEIMSKVQVDISNEVINEVANTLPKTRRPTSVYVNRPKETIVDTSDARKSFAYKRSIKPKTNEFTKRFSQNLTGRSGKNLTIGNRESKIKSIKMSGGSAQYRRTIVQGKIQDGFKKTESSENDSSSDDEQMSMIERESMNEMAELEKIKREQAAQKKIELKEKLKQKEEENKRREELRIELELQRQKMMEEQSKNTRDEKMDSFFSADNKNVNALGYLDDLLGNLEEIEENNEVGENSESIKEENTSGLLEDLLKFVDSPMQTKGTTLNPLTSTETTDSLDLPTLGGSTSGGLSLPVITETTDMSEDSDVIVEEVFEIPVVQVQTPESTLLVSHDTVNTNTPLSENTPTYGNEVNIPYGGGLVRTNTPETNNTINVPYGGPGNAQVNNSGNLPYSGTGYGNIPYSTGYGNIPYSGTESNIPYSTGNAIPYSNQESTPTPPKPTSIFEGVTTLENLANFGLTEEEQKIQTIVNTATLSFFEEVETFHKILAIAIQYINNNCTVEQFTTIFSKGVESAKELNRIMEIICRFKDFEIAYQQLQSLTTDTLQTAKQTFMQTTSITTLETKVSVAKRFTSSLQSILK